MIKVYALYDRWVVTEITPMIKSLSLTGSISQCARKLTGTITYSIFDRNHDRTQIRPNTVVWVVDDRGVEIFRGIVFDRQLNSSEELTFNAYDFLIYFTKSKGSYNFNQITAEDITRKICSEAEVRVGNIAKTGVKISDIPQNTSFYDIIMRAYTKARDKTNKCYIPMMNKDQFNLIEKGKLIDGLVLEPNKNIISCNYDDSMENMINRVKIFDENNNFLTKVENQKNITMYGVLQESVTKDDDGYMDKAKQMLQDIESNVNIEALGDIRCITGYAVKAKIWYISALVDCILYIDSDTHTFDLASNQHTMSLTASLQNKMDLKEGN
ncbi:XkdQ/YqbQ family protein [Clostridium sp. Marseille-Q7071]